MSVPFEKIGPGQSSRLVMQIMGKNGPVFNPNGIRYLPVEGAGLANVTPGVAGGLAKAATALAGMNLLVSAGTLALSAATLAETKKISAKVDRLLEGQAQLGQDLDQIVARLDRIEIKVSEARLATLVAHACNDAAIDADEISFVAFAELAGDLDTFARDAAVVRGVPSALRLGSDVRAALNRVVRLLRGVRLIIAEDFNRSASPDRVWRCDPCGDYWPEFDLRAILSDDRRIVDVVRACHSVSCFMHKGVATRFRLNTSKDHEFLQTAAEQFIRKMWSGFGVADDEICMRLDKCREDAVAKAAGGHVPANKVWLNPDYSDAYCELICQQTRRAWFDDPKNSSIIPPAVLDAMSACKDDQVARALLFNYRAWWLHHTDAGLVYRALCECEAVHGGYQHTWSSQVPDLEKYDASETVCLAPSQHAPEPVFVDLQLVTMAD